MRSKWGWWSRGSKARFTSTATFLGNKIEVGKLLVRGFGIHEITPTTQNAAQTSKQMDNLRVLGVPASLLTVHIKGLLQKLPDHYPAAKLMTTLAYISALNACVPLGDSPLLSQTKGLTRRRQLMMDGPA